MKFFKFFIHHTDFYKHSNLLKTRFFNGLLFTLITCCIPAITFSLEKDQLEERFKKLSNELRCPTCQGLAVKDSQAGFSTSIKGKIRELMEKGSSDDEILAYFTERYGEWILRKPPLSGFNLVLWILPGAAIITGFLWVLYRSKKWVEKPTKGLTELSPDEEQKIMDDLSRFENS